MGQHLLFIFAQVSKFYGHLIDSSGWNSFFKHSTFLFLKHKGLYPESFLSSLPLTPRDAPDPEEGLGDFLPQSCPYTGPWPGLAPPASLGRPSRSSEMGLDTGLVRGQQQLVGQLSSSATSSWGGNSNPTRVFWSIFTYFAPRWRGEGVKGWRGHGRRSSLPRCWQHSL